MSREVKRVPIDFDWPINKVWEGYVNPYYKYEKACTHCDATGYSEKAKELHDLWYGYIGFNPEDRGSERFLPTHDIIVKLAKRNCGKSYRREALRLSNLFNSSWQHHLNEDDVAALVEYNRLMDFTHTWSKERGWQLKDPPYVPTPREVNEWSLVGCGHDSINTYTVIEAECKRLGIAIWCTYCEGEGYVWDDLGMEKKCEEWEETEPPEGDGWQMWETTSEGSPISPVFETPEDLARWLSDTGASSMGSRTATYEQWLAMIKAGWSVSAISVEGEFLSGVEACSKLR